MLATFSIRLLVVHKTAGGPRYLFTNVRYKRSCGCGQLQVTNAKGVECLRNPRLNKELAFTVDERHSLGIRGLLPAAVRTQDEQAKLCKEILDRYSSNLSKCIYLYDLQERNERLFYRVLGENIQDLLPIIYTPTICQACEKYGLIFGQPRGLFISIYDRGRIPEVLMNWEETDVRAVVVTDGEHLTNIGDLGAHSMALPVGKAALYTAIGGVKPYQCLPITLDIGTNNEKLLKDPIYAGLRHHRTMGPTYLALIEEFVESIADRFGPSTVIQFEGFGPQNSRDFLQKYRRKCCVFSDDLQSVAAVALAGFLASETILGKPFRDYRILFLDAGDSSFAVANVAVDYLQKIGLSAVEATNRMWFFDEQGLLARSRDSGPPLIGDKLLFAKDFEPTNDALDVIKRVKPDVLVGTSGTASSFNSEVLYQMAEVNQRPLIFALTDPASKKECTAEDVYHHTQGRAIFASGSAFLSQENVSNNCVPSQANPCLVYPGMVLGTIASGLKTISDDIFPLVARCIANNVRDEDLRVGRILPPLHTARKCCIDVAAKICEYAYNEGLATYYPEPQDKKAFIRAHLYNCGYAPLIKEAWVWSDLPEIEHAEKKDEARLGNYCVKFDDSESTFDVEEDESEKDSSELEEPKADLDDMKIVEIAAPEKLRTIKPNPTA